MAIKYVQVLNSFVSTEGSNGFMTNYIYYSLLVVDTNGSAQIVEGKANSISHLLAYVRTPVDEIQELKETVKNLRNDINELANQKVKYVVDSLFPIPDITNKSETEAIALLEKAGLQPVLLNHYPETTPKNGVVSAFSRNSDNFKKVEVKIVHKVPEVVGLTIEEAQKQLAAAGFNVQISRKIVSGKENGTVLECTRADENSLNVSLLVSVTIPDVTGLYLNDAKKILGEAGYQTTVFTSVQPGEPGQVIRWDGTEGSVIKLYVCIPAKYEAKHVNVKWSNLQDSTGDSYSAAAEFDNKTRTLKVRLTYTIGAKVKHQLLAADIASTPRHRQDFFGLSMEPNVENLAAFSLPFGKTFEELPKELKVTLHTQYGGFTKKQEAVNLLLAFEW